MNEGRVQGGTGGQERTYNGWPMPTLVVSAGQGGTTNSLPLLAGWELGKGWELISAGAAGHWVGAAAVGCCMELLGN